MPDGDGGGLSRLAPMAPPAGGAVVRMYCTGLGDCFLLGFPAAGGGTAYVLIDCGVWKGTAGASEWMRTILRHVREEVGAGGLELLVATHQHWDHLSGFAQAREIFEDPGFRVKRVWLPWTEDPGDPTARAMADDRRMAFRAAVAAVTALRGRESEAAAAEDPEAAAQLATTVENLETLLKFSGYTPPGDAAAQAEDRELLGQGLGVGPGDALGLLGAGPTTDDLMDIVRRKQAPEYLRPSLAPRRLEEVPAVRIYALGPPTDPKLLGKDDPSKAPGKSEVYLTEDAALYAAAAADVVVAAAQVAVDRERQELAQPFDRWQRHPLASAAQHPEFGEFFRSRYLAVSPRAPRWRRIETDWLETASEIGLNLDSHVNNTSLALAFELGENGPVLLFPGDAQVGNWLSWHTLADAGGVTAAALLSRTVLYKVGHHGSHNATLKAKGLQLMTAPNLVAMLPVDEAEARKPKGKNKDGWAMPYDKLLADLEARTAGRVLRADREVPAAKFAPNETPVMEKVTVEVNGVRVEKILYLQYTVTAPGG